MSVFSRTSLWALLGAASLLGCSSKSENTYNTDRRADYESHAGWEDATVPANMTPRASWPSLAPDATTVINQNVTGAGGSAAPGEAGTGGSDAGTDAFVPPDNYVPPDAFVPPDAAGNVTDDFYVNTYLSLLNTWSFGTPIYTDLSSTVTYSGGFVRLQPLSGAYTTITPIAYSASGLYTMYGYVLQIGTNTAKYDYDYHGTSPGIGSMSIRVSSTVCTYLSTSCYATTIKVYPLTYYSSGAGYATGTEFTSIPVLIDCGGCP